MVRQAPWHHGDEVEPQIVRGELAIPLQERLGGAGDACLLLRLQGDQRVLPRRASFDLDEDQKLAASGDKIDLADRGCVAPGQDTKSTGTQQPGGQHLGEATRALAAAAAHVSVRDSASARR